MIARPFVNLGIEQLEEKFKKNGADPDVIDQLAFELSFRTKPRAVELRAKVLKVKNGGRLTQSAVQLGLRLTPETAPKRDSQCTNDAAPPQTPPQSESVEPLPPTVAVAPSVAELSLDQALKVLGLTLSAKWEQVENRRRELVETSNPEKLSSQSQLQRDKSLLLADEVNAAAKAMRLQAGWGACEGVSRIEATR